MNSNVMFNKVFKAQKNITKKLNRADLERENPTSLPKQNEPLILNTSERAKIN